jgi:hypothetical protein
MKTTASKIITEYAKRGAKIKVLGRMCSECAFKPGTIANLDDLTTQTCADLLAYGGGRFFCHKLPEGVVIDQNKPCIGFMHANQFLNRLEELK